MHRDLVESAAIWAGFSLSPSQLAILDRYRAWLTEEAAGAGGIGPRESEVEVRHLADSLLFGFGWAERRPERILDIGTGVGLPAIPLAIASPETEVVACDRSGRRIRLLRRAIRILDLPNLVPSLIDIGQVGEQFPIAVSRAALPPQELRPHLERILAAGGAAVVGGSHVSAVEEDGYQTVEVPAEVLDHPCWILIMARP